jgi:hypothetical protein
MQRGAVLMHPRDCGVDRRRPIQITTGVLADYNKQRRVWHANLGPIKAPQLAELHEDLWDIVELVDQAGLAQRPLPGMYVKHAALTARAARRFAFVHDGVDASLSTP